MGQAVFDPRARSLPSSVAFSAWLQMHGSVDSIVEAAIKAIEHQASNA